MLLALAFSAAMASASLLESCCALSRAAAAAASAARSFSRLVAFLSRRGVEESGLVVGLSMMVEEGDDGVARGITMSEAPWIDV